MEAVCEDDDIINDDHHDHDHDNDDSDDGDVVGNCL